MAIAIEDANFMSIIVNIIYAPVIKAESWTSIIVGRLFGSFSRVCSRSWTSCTLLWELGGSNSGIPLRSRFWSFIMLNCCSHRFVPYGCFPLVKMKNVTNPNGNTSILEQIFFPSWYVSGGWKQGVPAPFFSVVTPERPIGISLLRPKSDNLTNLLHKEISTLSGFKSRWMTLFLWRYTKPSTICLVNR